MVFVCMVRDCKNSKKSTKGKDCKLFSVPNDLPRCKKWLTNCGRTDLLNKPVDFLNKNCRVCNDHFNDTMFSNPDRTRLLPSAVPTEFVSTFGSSVEQVQLPIVGTEMINDQSIIDETVVMSTPSRPDQSISFSCEALPSPCSSFESSSTSISSQTTQVLSVNTPRKKKFRTEIRELSKKCENLGKKVESLSEELVKKTSSIADTLNSVEHFYKVCDIHLPPNLSMVVKSYVQMAQRKPQGMRYSNMIKQLALTIYFFGPRVYTFLKTLLQLPSPRTLRRVTEKIELVPGLNDILFEAMEFKINNLKEDAKECVLCVDEMAIKTNLFYNLSQDYIIGFNHSYGNKTYEPAKHVLCFMLRSLNYNWKQPVAYFFINNSCSGIHLQNTIFAVISRIQNTSLKIKVLTSDQGSNFISFAKQMNVSSERPFFFVNGKKIFYVFDVPHLLKSTRNNFFKYNLKFLKGSTDKKYLVDFYNSDQGLNRLAPKLTDIHINPGPFQKMKVRYASQVFSATVAAAMKTCVHGGTLPGTADTTIQFIDHMDKLFDLLNSKKKFGSKDFNRPFKNTTHQRKHLLLMSEAFKNMIIYDTKVVNGQIIQTDVTSRIKFLNGWQITINAVLQLWDEIATPSYVLCTYKLNQDCLENLFGNFRNQSGNNVNPTPVQFFWTFKKIFFINFFKHSDGSNCLEDLNDILTNIGEIAPPLCNTQVLFPEKTPFKLCNIKVGTVDYRELSLPASNALTYVSGYLIKKCLDKHNCDTCLSYGKNQSSLDQSFLFIYFKAYTNTDCSTFGNLNVPPDQFCNYVNSLDDIFVINFPTLAVENNVGRKLKNLIDNVPFNHPCPNFDVEFLKTLYIRLRIFHSIKYLNKNLLSTGRKHRKLDILSHL